MMFLLISKQSKKSFMVKDGETVIGRGPFLEVMDKRVSRSHALLSLNNGSLMIKPTHIHPTFILSSNSAKYVTLEKDSWKELNHGDTISLLPNDLIFVVESKTTEGKQDAASENKKPNDVKDCNETEKCGVAKCYDEKDNSERDASLISETCGKKREILNYEADENTKSSCKEKTQKDDSSKISMDATPDYSMDSVDDLPDDVQVITTSNVDDVAMETSKEDGKSLEINTTPFSKVSERDVKSTKSTARVLPSWMTSSPTPSLKETGKKRKPTKPEAASLSKKVKSDDSATSKATKIEKTDDRELNLSPALSKKTFHSNDVKSSRKSPISKKMKLNDDDGDIETSLGKAQERLTANEQDASLPQKNPQMPLESKSKIKRKSNEQGEHQKQDYDTGKQEKHQDVDKSASAVDDTKNENRDDSKEMKSTKKDSSSAQTGDASKCSVEKKKKLPKCQYGKSCYRKNPVHFQEYSHDDESGNESETDDDDLPECPYGTNCYRTNPQHISEYKHTKLPSGALNASHKQTRKSSRARKIPGKGKSVLAGGSDDDGDENDYDYDDSFIDDDANFESDSTSFDDEDFEEDSDYLPDKEEV